MKYDKCAEVLTENMTFFPFELDETPDDNPAIVMRAEKTGAPGTSEDEEFPCPSSEPNATGTAPKGIQSAPNKTLPIDRTERKSPTPALIKATSSSLPIKGNRDKKPLSQSTPDNFFASSPMNARKTSLEKARAKLLETFNASCQIETEDEHSSSDSVSPCF